MSDFRPDIWRLQAQANIGGLVKALKDNDPGIRRRAATALRTLGAVKATPALQEALVNEGDPETREAIVAALESLEQEKQKHETATPITQMSELEYLIFQLESEKSEQVIEAAHALGEMGDKMAVPALVSLFNDAKISIRVRLAVAEALLKLESAPVEVALLGALRSQDWRVRRNGAAILGQLRAEWAIDPLAKALFDENELVRRTAYAALKHIATAEATDALEKARQLAQRRKKNVMRPVDTSETAALLQTDEEQKAQPTVEAPMRPMPKPIIEEETDDEGEIVWPKNRRPVNPTLAPTKPFDPAAIERARRQMEEWDNDEEK
ncbi:MAG: hypothetical protein OHK0046_10570 [Anaerolineae bacterium]